MSYPEVGQRIKAAREAQGLTQETLAEFADISPNHMSVIERGIKSPNLDTFIAIANALGVSGDSLLQDVVVHSTESTANELYDMIRRLPVERQRRILAAVKLITEE